MSSEPKYPIGSSVTCSYLGYKRQCIVFNFHPEGRTYTIYALDDPGNHCSVCEESLYPWVEPGQPKFKVGDAVRKIGVANVKRYVNSVRLNSNNKYRYEMYWVGIGGHRNFNGLCNERGEDYELWTDSDEYQKNMEILTKDNQTYTNEQGGKQSFVSARFDCIPPVVLRLLAQCLGFGARKYGKDNWKQIEQWDHLSHAMNHINEWNRGDRSEPHLVNAMARLTFALWQAVEQGQQSDTYTNISGEERK